MLKIWYFFELFDIEWGDQIRTETTKSIADHTVCKMNEWKRVIRYVKLMVVLSKINVFKMTKYFVIQINWVQTKNWNVKF